jgi:peptidoglycan/LPS O-acetylase OafA/YrhL
MAQGAELDAVAPGSRPDADRRPPRGRLDSLTGLRALAAFVVFLTHVQGLFQDGPASTFMERIGTQGFTGVSFFFILSGFVLTWSHRPGDRPRAFYRRRFARIAPAYWTALVLAVALNLLLERERGVAPVWESLPSFLALQAWWPDPAIYFGGNGPGWSISCEAFFYATFPLLILLLPRFASRLPLTAWLVLLAGIAGPLALHPTEWPTLESWAVAHLPLLRLPEFVLGICLALAVQRGWRPRLGFRTALALCLAAYLAAGWVPLYAIPMLTLPPFAMLIAVAATRDIGGRPTSMARPWPRRLGEWSFAFYLVHELVLRVVIPVARRIDNGLPVAIAAAVVGLALGVLCAFLLYTLVERPLEKRLRGAPARPEMVAAADPAEPPRTPGGMTAIDSPVTCVSTTHSGQEETRCRD